MASEQIVKGDKITVGNTEYTFEGSANGTGVYSDPNSNLFTINPAGEAEALTYVTYQGRSKVTKSMTLNDLGGVSYPGVTRDTININGVVTASALQSTGTKPVMPIGTVPESAITTSTGSAIKAVVATGEAVIASSSAAIPNKDVYATTGNPLSYSTNSATVSTGSSVESEESTPSYGSYTGGGDPMSPGYEGPINGSGMWDFTADSEIQQELAKSLNKAAEDFNTRIENMYQEIESMGSNSYWVGEDYDAFKEGTEGYKTALSDLATTMNMYANHFERVADGTEQFASEIIQMIENATTGKQ